MKAPWIFALIFAIVLWYILPPRISRILPLILVVGGLYWTETHGGGIDNVFNFVGGEWDKLK